MKRTMRSGILVCLLTALSLVASQQTSGKNFVFDVPDLTSDFPDMAGGTVNLQGFQITDNQKIIENKYAERYGELMWVSVGNPRVSRYSTTGSSPVVGQTSIYPEMFTFRDDGFNIAITTLNDAHREKLKEIVKQKYGIDIKISQIVNLMLSSLQCQLSFFTANNTKMSIFGEAKNMLNYPIVVSFEAPKGSTLRAEFEKKLKSYVTKALPIEKVDLTIDCKMKSEAKTTKTNYFSINSLQVATLGLAESIFGPTQGSAFVSRDQMQTLSQQIYTKLRVYEEYQIPSERFKDSFVTELINQVSTESLKYVSLEQALASLSTYDIYQDLKPDLVRQELSRLLKVESVNGKQYIKADRAYAEAYEKSKSSSGSASLGATYAGVGIEASASYAESKSDQWQKGTSSVDEQMNELNKYEQNEVEWERRGEIIVPKSFKVSRLSRSSFTKGITIERIFRVAVDSSFEKRFVIGPSDFQFEDYFSKLLAQTSSILDQQNTIKKFITDSFGQSPSDLTKTISSYSDLINATIPDIKSSSRLTLVPRGTILQVALSVIEQSFNSDGKGLGDYDGWVICNGQNGTPDLRRRFLVGHDIQSNEYSTIGQTGGRKQVKLNETHLPEHRHYINLYTGAGGAHLHTYKDVFYSDSSNFYDLAHVPHAFGSGGKADYDNYGSQMTRETDTVGTHNHQVTGYTDLGKREAAELDIRPEYYTVVHIMFTGVYNQKSTSQVNLGI